MEVVIDMSNIYIVGENKKSKYINLVKLLKDILNYYIHIVIWINLMLLGKR